MPVSKKPCRKAARKPQRKVEAIGALPVKVPWLLWGRRKAQILWAARQVEIGSSLSQDPLGERADNLERAIAHYGRRSRSIPARPSPRLGGDPEQPGGRLCDAHPR